MSVTIHCPHCGATGNAPDHILGQSVRCSKCKKQFVAGGEEEHEEAIQEEPADDYDAFVGEKFIAEAQLLGGAPYAPNRRGQPAAGAQLAFVTDEFERDWRRAVEAGATIVKAPELKPWGQTTGYLGDCNGTIVELCTPSHRDS